LNNATYDKNAKHEVMHLPDEGVQFANTMPPKTC